MLEHLAVLSRPVLDVPYIRRTRRNHALEHATITLLTRRGSYQLSGRSDSHGFILMGAVPTTAVESAAHEALRRMRNGEHNLAVHPNCGTNLVTTGLLTGLIGWAGLSGRSRRAGLDRLPLVITAMMVAILYGPLLGMRLQKHFTTEGNPGDLTVAEVTRREFKLPFNIGPTVVIHRVETRAG
jgi:hypothetical protein